MGTTTPRRLAIIQAMVARLEEISVANGYRTNVGADVRIGEAPHFGPDDPDEAIALVIGEDRVMYQGANLFIELPMEVHALARADIDDPWAAVEAAIADVKEAVELDDRTLGGLVPRMIERGSTRPYAREEGSLAVGAVIPYIAPYKEAWGKP